VNGSLTYLGTMGPTVPYRAKRHERIPGAKLARSAHERSTEAAVARDPAGVNPEGDAHV